MPTKKLKQWFGTSWLRSSRDDQKTIRILEASGETGVTLEADAEGESKVRKFNGIAYTGGKVDVGFGLPVVVDLSGIKVSRKSRPILRDHDASKIVGHTENVEISTSRIKVAGLISAANEYSREVQDSAANNFPWQMSIGARVIELDEIPEGEAERINGRKFNGPIYVARKSELYETSFVALGADDNTSASVTAEAHLKKDLKMGFDAWLKANGWDAEKLSEKQREQLEAAYKAETSKQGTKPESEPQPVKASSTTDPEDPSHSLRAQYASEMKEIAAIRKTCGDKHEELAAQAIEEGWSIDRVKAEVADRKLKALQDSRPKVDASSGLPKDHTHGAITASLCLTLGMPEEIVKGSRAGGDEISDDDMNRATSQELRNLSLHAIMDMVIEASGGHFRGNRKSSAFIEAAANAHRSLKAAGGAGFSTLSLPGILSNIANKAMQASYAAQETVHQKLCAIRSHNDFKPHVRYRLDASGGFRRVGPDGELKTVGLQETGFTNRVETDGAIIALTRVMMMNDDLGSFAELPMILGRMSAVRAEELFFILLLTTTMFSTDNKNLLTGASGALSIEGLTLARKMFRGKVDKNGKPILTTPRMVLVGTALEVLADEIYNEAKVDPGSSNKKVTVNNPHYNKYKPVVSPYLDNTDITDSDGKALTGQSDTLWYHFADPAQLAAFGMATLNGRTTPVIETSDSDFTTLGTQMRAYHDIGFGEEDPAGAVKVAGA